MGVFNNHWPPIIEILRNTLAFTYSLTYLLAVLLYACGLRLVDVTRLTETGGNSSVAPFIADSNQRSSLAPIHWYSHSFIHHFLSLSTHYAVPYVCWPAGTGRQQCDGLKIWQTSIRHQSTVPTTSAQVTVDITSLQVLLSPSGKLRNNMRLSVCLSVCSLLATSRDQLQV